MSETGPSQQLAAALHLCSLLWSCWGMEGFFLPSGGGPGWLIDGWTLAARFRPAARKGVRGLDRAIPVSVGGLKDRNQVGGHGQDHPLTWRMSVTCAAIYLPAPESRSIRSLRKRNTDSKSTMTVGPGRLAEPPGLTQMSLSDDNSTQDNGTLRLPLARSIGLV